MSVRGCAHGFAFGYCPTCQGLNPGLTPPVVFDFTGQSPERYAKAMAVVEAARPLQCFRSPVYAGSTDCGQCVACRVRADLAAFDEVEGS